MDYDYEIEEINDDELLPFSSSEEINDDSHDEYSNHHVGDSISSLVKKLQEKIQHHNGEYAHEVSFGASIYTDAEINKLKNDIDMAEYEVTARESDVSNWESKVSLNNTEEHKKNGDYANAVAHLNEAKSRYNTAVDRLNAAKAKLNNVR